MAQRNQPVRPATKAKSPTDGPNTPKPAAKPPVRKPGKSIVNQRQTPWGLISVAVLLVIFAAGVVGYAVHASGSKDSPSASGETSSAPKKDVAASTVSKEQILKDLPGITVKTFDRNHVEGVIDYGADSPPFGGNHNQNWAECTGIVYSKQIANENAVHTLEHGAIWVTYNPDLPAADVAKLAAKVSGNNYMLMTPYAGLKTPVSLQAWGYQMFFQSVDDPKIDVFIKDLRLNKNTTPEYGASCDNPQFIPSQSYPGHPASLA
ncbi:uncharacterized protein DUF3105 [Jatrophihabitans sp. GAS493]|uniref:DUF3105 domain-containing protein n=1 Tax=Jatrophihabitans sp. GAS493 TaxID=1907575 RepID=UPI000BC072CC|nr:DUF3105 domain-containing protein [Jatrophihabitans sp. GAS493]SOD73293.1 uncharacterized protein DUF3105 [Jatrophihabitans sp. GAS493]